MDTQQAGDLMDLILTFEAQKKVLADDKRRVDEALTKAKFDLAALLVQNNLTGLTTDRAVAVMETGVESVVEDWGDLYAHITATGDYDLLYRRLAVTAANERRAAGVHVPGVGVRPVTTLKVKPKLR